jgi:enamine deaminase RidA (YjgF/YER057c/UK114 family)
VAYLPQIRLVRDEFIDSQRRPASTAVQVAALIRPELLLEVEAWAIVP